MLTFSTLELGNPTDARTWEAGCRSLGMDATDSVMAAAPGLARLRDFFAGEPDWVYFSGHFGGGELWADNGDAVIFRSDRVIVESGGASAELVRDDGFRMHINCSLVIWGGCSACANPSVVRAMRELFVNPTILGYAGSTGWKINDAMLGGGFIRRHFFANLRSAGAPPYNSAAMVAAWMGAAKAGYGGVPMEGMFRAIDNLGQGFELRQGEIVAGRSF